ncbi:cyclase family protein [Longivirga aurantiaca]|uniref:Cyclase family protein n=1 Tax=Longivirga aurantiaca TaxID=1837743 RepID=A0ABW1SXX1_9ACTN
MTGYAATGDAEPSVNTDYVGMDFHGKSVTHLDALCHCVFRGRLYNGYDSETHVGDRGGDVGTVAHMAHGVVTRGVLVDVPRSRGLPWLDPGTAIGADELESVLAEQGVSLRPGDAVLVRTGARARKDALGAWDPSNFSAGLGPDCMQVLSRDGSALLGSDGDSDARPSPVAGIVSPIHALALNAMGMPLIDNMSLEDLAVACADLDRWEFLFAMAPLRIPGGTGSPVNPLAVL